MALARVLVPRLLAVLVMLGGLALVVLGLQRTAAFGDGSDLLGRMPRVTGPVVVTAPGMLELSGATVRVRAASDSTAAPVFIGVGRAADVEAYLDGVARAEVTALEDLQVDGARVLRVSDRAGEPSLPDPAGVDVWAASVRAVGVATLTWPRTPGRWQLVIATDGALPPSAAEFTWSGEAGDSPAPAMLAVGALLAVVGVAGLLAMRSGRLFARTLGPDDDEDAAADGGPGGDPSRDLDGDPARSVDGAPDGDPDGEGAAVPRRRRERGVPPGPARRPGSARRDRRNARLAAERLEVQRLELQRLEVQRLAAERLEAQRLAEERLAAGRLAEEGRAEARPEVRRRPRPAHTGPVPLGTGAEPAPEVRSRPRPAHTGPLPLGATPEPAPDTARPAGRREAPSGPAAGGSWWDFDRDVPAPADGQAGRAGAGGEGQDDGDEEAPQPVLPFRRRGARTEEDR